jgi:hypothetical protein
LTQRVVAKRQKEAYASGYICTLYDVRKTKGMDIFKSLFKNHGPDVSSDYVLPPKPRNFEECMMLAENAVRASEWGKKEAGFLWLDVISNCHSLGLDLRSVFEAKLSQGKTVLESCLASEDWESCLVIAHALPEDRYCSGRVQSYKKGLILSEDGLNKQKGVLESDEPGCYYGGALSKNQRHGKGIVKLGLEHFFEGDFVDNQKHGRGVYRKGKDAHIVSQGLYINGLFVGNPYAKKKTSLFAGLLRGSSNP